MKKSINIISNEVRTNTGIFVQLVDDYQLSLKNIYKRMTKMNYKQIYDSIIRIAQQSIRSKQDQEIYYEGHHVVPKCLNGSNNKDNIVLLTAKEHFICQGKKRPQISGENHPMYGKFHSEETKIKISKANKGRLAWNKNTPRSEETKRKISETLKKRNSNNCKYEIKNEKI